MELKGKLDVINGKEYIELPGYPSFRFRFDKKTRKYSIINSKYIGTKETEPFIDEIIYSEKPLETWTANYIVVRIGEYYYLADCDGNCFFENSEKYLIGRNLFLSGDRMYIVNEELKKITIRTDEIIVRESGGYLFVCRKIAGNSGIYLLTPIGELGMDIKFYSRTLDKWYIDDSANIFFNKEFKKTKTVEFGFMYGNKSRSYLNVKDKEHIKTHFCEAYSTYFHDSVLIMIYGELEIIKYEGKIYFFDKDGNVEQTDASNPFFIRTDDMIFYRIGTTVYVRNKDGKLLEPIHIEWNQLYQYILMEKQVERSLAIKLNGGN